MVVGLLTIALYYMAAAGRGTVVPLDLLLPFQALPLLGSLMWQLSRETYLRCVPWSAGRPAGWLAVLAGLASAVWPALASTGAGGVACLGGHGRRAWQRRASSRDVHRSSLLVVEARLPTAVRHQPAPHAPVLPASP